MSFQKKNHFFNKLNQRFDYQNLSTWVWRLNLPLTSCMTLGKLFNFYFSFFTCKMEIIVVSTFYSEYKD